LRAVSLNEPSYAAKTEPRAKLKSAHRKTSRTGALKERIE